MQGFLAVAWTGVVAVVQYPLRSIATLGCVLAVLVPYLAGLGISRGLQAEAEASIRFGADLYVSADELGEQVPLPVRLVEPIRRIDGVTRVEPRIVAPVVLGKNHENAVLVGLPPAHFPAGITCVDGRLPRPGPVHELVLGTELAGRLDLHVGSVLPPFYQNEQGERLSRVVGIFRSDVPASESNLMLTTFDSAEGICACHGLATQILVYCRPDSEARVRDAILQQPSPARSGAPRATLRVTTRAELAALLPQGLFHREGVFHLLFLVAFAVAILVILVTAGVGTSGRRREIGILKALGWQTDEVLLRSLAESLILSVGGAAVSVLLAWVWLRLVNGYWVASVFLPGLGVRPHVRVPFSLTPVPTLLAFLVAALLVLVGSLYSTWRAAIVQPREAMRS